MNKTGISRIKALISTSVYVILTCVITFTSNDAMSQANAQVLKSDKELALISELTGLTASNNPIGANWVFSDLYGVYLPQIDKITASTQRVAAERTNFTTTFNSTFDVLMIPESTNKRIMTFDAVTGDLIDPDFITLDASTGTPIHAILSASGTILVSDQTGDVVHEYDLSGNYLGIFAPAGGVNTSILDNIRGIALKPNGNLLVTVASGANAGAIAEFDTGGNYLGNFVAIGSGGLSSPFDVYERIGTDWLVSEIDNDVILRYNLTTGAFLASLASINTFPEQICELTNGNILVANFSGTQEGIVELTGAGSLVGVYKPSTISGFRGAYELPNGNILTTTGSGVYEIDRSGNIVSTKFSGASCRFIQFASLPSIQLTMTVGTTPGVCAPTNNITVSAGTEVYYCYQIRNNTSTTLSLHDLIDSELGIILSGFPYTLAPGAYSPQVIHPPTTTTNVTSTPTWTAYNAGPTD
ncbi:MAG: hypothetical protein R6W71_05635, partial [Bacteroidales bacterium]